MTSAPPYAVRIWTDPTSIYVEHPMKDGSSSYISRYPLSEGGLAKAIAFMSTLHEATPSPVRYSHATTQPPVRRFSNFTENQRDMATSILRKLKIIGGGLH